MLAHHVYFTLEDDSTDAQQALIDGCRKYLTDHHGIESFAVGRRAEGLDREVNDQGFHVTLQIVFRDRAAHDAYQTASRHDQFIAENQDNWQQVRVFDTDV